MTILKIVISKCYFFRTFAYNLFIQFSSQKINFMDYAWQLLPFAGVPVALAGLIIGVIGFWEVIEQKLLLKRLTNKAEGKVIATVQATYRVNTQQPFNSEPEMATFSGASTNANNSYMTGAGQFLWLEFEDHKGVTHSVKTKRPYENAENIVSLPIVYSPEKPDVDFVIDNFHSYSHPILKLLGSFVLILFEVVLILYSQHKLAELG
jgi:hypothetical protein